MALNALTLASPYGVKGRPFRSKIEGLTAGTEVTAELGFGVLNGILVNAAMPNAPEAHVSITERVLGTGETKTTRVEIEVFGRTDIYDRALELVPEGETLERAGSFPSLDADGSFDWYAKAITTDGERLVSKLIDDGGAGLPEGATAYASFESGTFNYDGNSIDDFLTEDTNWGVFDPAAVVAGVGLTDPDTLNIASPVLAPGLTAELLADGFTAVFTYTRTSAIDDGLCLVAIEMLDLPDWNHEWIVTCVGANGLGSIYDSVVDDDLANPIQGPGQHKAAFTLSDGLIALSVDGSDAISAVPIAATPNTIALQVIGGVALEQFVIYPPKTAAEIKALSAL